MFTGVGQTLRRTVTTRAQAAAVWAEDPGSCGRRNLTREEHQAFWAWAAVGVLRHSGIRIEELTELTHSSLVQYRLPATSELVPLLHIAPSKTDSERLLVIGPELADVLSAIVCRVRDPGRGGAAGSRLRLPRAGLSTHRCRSCSKNASAPSTAPSMPLPSASCWTRRWPPPASPAPTASHCDSSHMISGGSSSPRPC